MPFTLISLTSREAMANLIPAMELKPDKVILLTTANFQREAGYLKFVLESQKIPTIIYDRGIDAYRTETIRKAVRTIIEKEKHREIILNITGGTKLMAIAAYEEFRNAGKAIVYCDTFNRQLLYIYPSEKTQPLTQEIKISHYLGSYGYSITEEETGQYNPVIGVLMDFIFKHFQSFSNGVDRFRKSMRQNMSSFEITHEPYSFIKDHKYYYVEIHTLNETIEVDSTFLHGKWLEFLVYHFLITSRRFPSKMGVKILQHGEIPNEIDVVYMKNYQLHLVSCKSGRYEPKDLFELDTLRHLTGGTFGVGTVVMTSEPTEAFERRAKELNLKTIWLTDPEDLEELP